MKHVLTLIILLSLVLFAPQGFAQAQSPATYHGDTATDYARRLSAEAGFGILFGTIAGSVPLITGLGISYTDFQKNPFFPKERPYLMESTLIASAILYPAGVACGNILGGYMTDSRSGYWEPFVGAYVGAVIADVTAYFLQEDAPIFSAILVLLLPVITSTIAMETAHSIKKHGERSRYLDQKRSANRAFMPFSFKVSF